MSSMSPPEYRIRVCCSEADNMVFPGAAHGFVTTLATNLRVRVGQLTGNPEACQVNLSDEDGGDALFLVVLSPNWVQDSGCAGALEGLRLCP